MNTKSQGTKPFEISDEELEPLLDLALAKKAEADAKQAEADAKEARRLQRQDERRAKASDERQHNREAVAEQLRSRELFEWLCAETE